MANVLGFIVVTIISIAFAAVSIFRPESLDSVWQAARNLPIVAQVVVWVLFVPWMLSLWIWRSSWPVWLRLVLVFFFVVGTPVAFFPRQR